MARRSPDNEEFNETIRYCTTMLEKHGVVVRLGIRVSAIDVTGYEIVVLATGLAPRIPAIPSIYPPDVNDLRRSDYEQQAGRTNRGGRSGPEAPASTSANSWLPNNHLPETLKTSKRGKPNGLRGSPKTTRRADHPGARTARSSSRPAATQQSSTGQTVRQNQRMDAPSIVKDQRRSPTLRSELRSDSPTTVCTSIFQTEPAAPTTARS